MPDRNITFEIKAHLGTITKYETNWRKEINLVSWNGGTAKFDIRDWDARHVKMSKGITLTPWEMRKLMELYFAYNNEQAVARGRALEEERNVLRAASNKRRDTGYFDESPVDEPFDVDREAEAAAVSMDVHVQTELAARELPPIDAEAKAEVERETAMNVSVETEAEADMEQAIEPAPGEMDRADAMPAVNQPENYPGNEEEPF